MIRWEAKRPDEVRDYSHDWSPFLGDDTITGTPTVIVDGVTKDSQAVVGNIVKVWLSDGTDGTVAHVTQTIVTAAGRTETEFFSLRIGADEPVTLAEAKLQCRMEEDDSDDVFIDSLIPAARAYCERVSTHVLVRRVVTETFRRWGDYLQLTKKPIVVTDDDPIVVSYMDASGEDTDYTSFLHSDGRIYPGIGTSFPGLGHGGSVTVAYLAGYEEGSNDEALLIARRAMLLLIGHWFEFREAAMAGIVSSEIAFAVSSLLDSIRPVSAY